MARMMSRACVTTVILASISQVASFLFEMPANVSTDGLLCYNCTHELAPRFCENLKKCKEDETCYRSSAEVNGRQTYSSGCLLEPACKLISSLGAQGPTETKYECCNTDFCNLEGFGYVDLPRSLRGPHCYYCNSVGKTFNCLHIKTCGLDEVCTFVKNQALSNVYEHKCVQKSNCDLMVETPYCDDKQLTCCDRDYCNNKCVAPTSPTTTTTTATTTETTTTSPKPTTTTVPLTTTETTSATTTNAPTTTTTVPLTTAPKATTTTVPLTTAPKATTTTVPLTTAPKATTTTVPLTTAPKATTTTVPLTTTPKATTTTVPLTTAPKATTTTVPLTTAPKATTTTVPLTTAPKATTTTVPLTTAPKATTTTVPLTTAPKATTTTVPLTTTPKATTTTVPLTTAPKATTTTVPLTAAPKATTTNVPLTTAPKATTTTVPLTTTTKPTTTVPQTTTTTVRLTTTTATTSTTKPPTTTTTPPPTTTTVPLTTTTATTSAPTTIAPTTTTTPPTTTSAVLTTTTTIAPIETTTTATATTSAPTTTTTVTASPSTTTTATATTTVKTTTAEPTTATTTTSPTTTTPATTSTTATTTTTTTQRSLGCIPKAPSNGRVSVNTLAATPVATYTCNTGYSIAGSVKQTCLTDGSWSAAIPTCYLQGTQLCDEGAGYVNIGYSNPPFCVKVYNETYTFPEAVLYCDFDNAKLVSPNSPEKMSDIRKYMQDHYPALNLFYIGVLDSSHNQTFFEYSNGNPATYLSFMDGEPSLNSLCVGSNAAHNYDWQSIECSSKLPSICETPVNMP